MRLPVAFVRLPLAIDADSLAREVADLDANAWKDHPEGAVGNTAVPVVAAHGDPADDAVAGSIVADNGGPTQTMALELDSPAIDAGPDPVPEFPGNEYDQRVAGFPRVVNGKVDIGAFEVQPKKLDFTG